MVTVNVEPALKITGTFKLQEPPTVGVMVTVVPDGTGEVGIALLLQFEATLQLPLPLNVKLVGGGTTPVVTYFKDVMAF